MNSADLLRPLADRLLGVLTVRTVEGEEHLPPPSPCIVVANHLSFLDAVIVFAMIGGAHTTAWAAEKWEHNLVFGSFLRLGNAFFIQRGQVDRVALDRAADWLRAGGIFGMAPEGTRSKGDGLGIAKTGVAYLADASGAAILPVAHWGTETTMRSWAHMRRPHIHIRVGRPFHLPEVDPLDRAGCLRRNSDEVMVHLASLLPPAYRGVYGAAPPIPANPTSAS